MGKTSYAIYAAKPLVPPPAPPQRRETFSPQLFIQHTPSPFIDTKRSAKRLFENLKEHFDMSLEFQLRRIGLSSTTLKNTTTTTNSTIRCYGPLGCLEITDDWYGISRPVNVLPQNRKSIGTKFILHTRDTRSHPQYINASNWSLDRSNFKASRPTKLIVHGFLDSAQVFWVKEMTDALLDYMDFNVIVVDWNAGARAIYSQAAANTRLVGLEVASLIEYLITQRDCKAKGFHLIGHSLGSHISGYAGEALIKKYSQKLGRISGLDPAEPLFQSMPEFVRLDPSDAEFVDAIHTDSKSIIMLGYGMMDPVGHVDFYPNGGVDQPGCALMDFHENFENLDDVGRHLVACSHDRALQYYIESIRETNSTCKFIAHECSSYEKFKQGSCFVCGKENEHCSTMGIRADEFIPTLGDRKNVKFLFGYWEIITFTAVNYICMIISRKIFYDSNYLENHYLLEINLAKSDEAEQWVQGFMKTNLYGSKGELMDVDLTPDGSTKFVHGTKIKRLISTNSDLVCVLLCSDKIYLRSVSVIDHPWYLSTSYFLSLVINLRKPNLTNSPTFNHSTNLSIMLHFFSITFLKQYDNSLRPGIGGPPLLVEINIQVRSMGPISEVDMSYSMDCYFRQSWVDTRLAFSGQKNLALSIEMLNKIWKPDTYIYNGRKSYLHTITTPNKFVRLFPEGKVLYSQRLTIKASCNMDLADFPMDQQSCPLQIGSFGYSVMDLAYVWTTAGGVSIASDMKLSQFDLIQAPTGNSTVIVNNGAHSTLLVNFHLQRHMGNFMIQVYGPCILLVVISWVSFWLNREATSDRINLGVTTVLTMTFLGLEARTDLPQVAYATALDYFVFISFIFIFSTVVQVRQSICICIQIG
ncbi:GABRA [Lepeophtheirus salmonis]|uniref:GABRA n=1 Tax=Lepeophtheirus salmonis TaxID=72036 RepID=A0A7R8CUT0_LEPSM|nr:GABRA [Lepeophtheirus salmonis]CAF2939216.1 GABRA [Lepeophtheirus salmonis]